MASQHPNSFETGGRNPAAGLDSRLRGLSLASASPGEPQPPRPALHVLPGREASANAVRQPEPASRARTRRPNQAQRRQMSSQAHMPLEAGAWQLPHQNGTGTGPPGRRANGSYGSSPWIAASGNPSTPASWSANAGLHMHGRPGPFSALQQDPSLVPKPRYGPGPPQAQRRTDASLENIASQVELLEVLCHRVIPRSEIQLSEITEKENFRQRIELICRDVISRHERVENNAVDFHPSSVDLKCFGSLSSGFATNASDMDLGLLSPMSKIAPDAAESPIPRLLEQAFLDAGLGARLLSRTRVPIIKLCEEPPESLRRALLAEREKWEHGAENETTEAAADDLFEDEITLNPCDDVNISKSKELEPSTEFEIPNEDGAARRFRLWQGPDHTLAAYYGLAKRLLRRAGGRDVVISNYREFTASDWVILNRVCQAFVQGLSDPLLRERLARYPSLSFEPQYNMPSNRSLFGVFMQMEGEQAMQSWEAWPAAADELYGAQPQAEQALAAWRSIQWRRNFGVDPVQYTRDLQVALERIKRVPCVQLVLLEQGQQETPSQYSARFKGILNGLRYDPMAVSGKTRLEVVKRYISGVTQHDVRDFLDGAVAHSNGEVDFEALGLGHRAFHLARQLESALHKKAWDASRKSNVTDYIALLRSPPRQLHTGSGALKFIIPVPPECVQLVQRIRSLNDIHYTATNQPRDRHQDHLEFPTSGAGVQCDINFSAHLALHNTALLRCYSHTDVRVRPMVLFVKNWAKVRGINSGYRGTLSSYGYVLMVLHYLVNVAQPFVCPNLQHLAPRPSANPSPAEIEATLICRGCNVQFWRNEREILHLAGSKQLNHNGQSLGELLRGFFEYFAHTGILSSGPGRGFDWGRDVLSLRAQHGLVSKQEKGWTGAKTVFEVQSAVAPQAGQVAGPDDGGKRQPLKKGAEVKEIRHRYLFAIEDPFELDHNVARTVTHNGIVSIRDEFRRAWRIIRAAGTSAVQEDLLQDDKNMQSRPNPFLELLDEIHGPEGTWGSMG